MENPFLNRMNHATHIVYYASSEPYYWHLITKLLSSTYTDVVRPELVRGIEQRVHAFVDGNTMCMRLGNIDALAYKIGYTMIKSMYAQVNYTLVAEAILWDWERKNYTGFPKLEDIAFSQLNPEE